MTSVQMTMSNSLTLFSQSVNCSSILSCIFQVGKMQGGHKLDGDMSHPKLIVFP